MITRATVKIKIAATKDVIKTINVYDKGLQFCVDVAWKRKIRNNVKLHPFVYRSLRGCGLPSQLAVACIKQACGMVKKAKSKPIIKRACVRYNFPRSANLKGDILAIRTLTKRAEFKLNIPDYFKEYFSWDVKESLLKMDKRGRCFFLFTFAKEVDVQSSDSGEILGIDLGINNLAVTSTGEFFRSGKVKQVKRRFSFLRAKLQVKGTRSAKQLLRKVSGRETRFMTWMNHNISKQIVSGLSTGDAIVMENLKGIRKVRRGKRMNYWISNWSFYQLQNFIQYKAGRMSIGVKLESPVYTSKLCHKCGLVGSRSKACFSCFHCGLTRYSADVNAAKNLAHPMLVERQAAVNQPNVSSDDAKAPLLVN